MTKTLFSILVGPVDPAPSLEALLDQIARLRKGVFNLLEPLGLHGKVEIHRAICSERKEWLEVRLADGRQMSLLEELEKSLGIDATALDIESRVARAHAADSIRILRELQIRRVWKAGEFLNRIGQWQMATPITAVGRSLQDQNGSLSIRLVDGQTSTTGVPHRGFSAIASNPVDVTFLPAQVGMDKAIVTLAKQAKYQVRSKTRRIEVSWHSEMEERVSNLLFTAAKSQRWVRARCGVVVNSQGEAKALLMECLLSDE
jgi:hypothetical protein